MRKALTLKQILAWADAHHKRTGRWPTKRAGSVRQTPGENWVALDASLKRGHRGLAGGLSLAGLLARDRQVRNSISKPRLKIKQILSWADAHHRRIGKWPIGSSGSIPGAPDENWSALSQALDKGARGLPAGGSLARLLAKSGRRRNRAALPRLTVNQIIAWADAHHKRTGQWPAKRSGAVRSAPGETWTGIASAMQVGSRGLPGGQSLRGLLMKRLGVRHPLRLPTLTVRQILAWADQHYRRTGRWPIAGSGCVPGSGDESWSKIDSALMVGYRGFAGGSSLAQLLEKRRAVRNIQHLPRLTIKMMLKWIDAHHKRTGRWPTPHSGEIPDSGGETWNGIQAALFLGHRGFRGGFTLAKFLDKRRGVRNIGNLPALKIHQILRWADGHHKRTGKWPKNRYGRVPEAPGEKWSAIHVALEEGLRGLRAGSSLPRLLSKHRGVRNVHDLPRLATKQILKWADAFHKREKAWPRRDSGHIPRSGGENWEAINHALKKGNRGLSGGWSLSRFLNRYRRPERGL